MFLGPHMVPTVVFSKKQSADLHAEKQHACNFYMLFSVPQTAKRKFA